MSNFSWKKTNAPMSSSRTDDIWFIDENTGWAVNSNGQILFTSDGGNSWTQQAILTNSYLRCVSFADSRNGWVGTVTAAKKMLRTQDGGKSWKDVNNLPAMPNAICGLYAVNRDVVYAAGTNWPNRPTGVIKTTDGGATWSRFDMSKSATLLVDIYFLDPNKGWVVGGYGGTTRDRVKPVVLYTEDGGISWNNQLAGQEDQFPFGEWGWKIHFVDEVVGFISLENFQAGAVLKTIDGGMTWKRYPVNDPQGNANLEGVGFWDKTTGWVGGWGDENFKKGYTSESNDGGINWRDANYVGKFINRFRFLGNPRSVGYASGDTVYKYSTTQEVISLSPMYEPTKAIVLNRQTEIYSKEIAIDFNVSVGAKYLEINVWDRFGGHQATLLKEKNPRPGLRHISWKFPVTESKLPKEYYIYRVSIDDTASSRIVIRNNETDGSEIVKSLQLLLSNKGLDKTPLPTFEQEKEAFFRIANIEEFSDFLPIAKEMAVTYLAHVDYNATSLYNMFEYSDEAFDERMKQIYEAVLPDMYKPHPYDKDVIEWRNGKKYRIGRASDKVVRDRILQLAPFNLMDGVWLQNIMQARPSDEVQARLFEIWADEVGNGSTRQNHSNVYQDLLRSQGIYLPPVTSRSFLEIDVAPGAWRAPVFQMSIGLFAENFFPELIGMTLYLEWEATPTLMPAVLMLKGRGMNPLFYSLHVAIDNISEGHGALAKEAVKIFLEEKREEGGERAVQENWKRIWNGYVGWATAGFSGEGLAERRLIIDKISINLGTPEQPQCFPDWRSYYSNRMINLIRAKAPVAKQVHGRATIDGSILNELFDKPEELMQKLISSGTLNPETPRQSRFFDLISFEGPMYKVFNDQEKEIILDWLEAHQSKERPCINPLQDGTPSLPLPQKIYKLISDFSGLARRAHDQIELPDKNGQRRPLIAYLDKPKELLEAMIRGGWIVPGNSDRSFFITRILQNGGPMQGVFPNESLIDLIDWVNAGAELPEEADMSTSSVMPLSIIAKETKSSKEEFALLRPFIGQGAVH